MLLLEEFAKQYGTDKLSHGYCPYYERHLPPRETEFSLLEIGVLYGDSLRMWRDYFPNAQIYGVDVELGCMFKEERITTILGDAGSNKFWDSIDIPNLKVIIDDGSHWSTDILNTFYCLWDRLDKDDLYVIEDLATQWTSIYGGGHKGSPVIRMLEEKLGETLLYSDVSEMHLYTEIVFLKK